MPPKDKSSAPAGADAGFVHACAIAAELSRDELRSVAVARGCSHYAPLWPDLAPAERSGLPHEVLGCALLRGPATAETFQSIRCGAMILSDLGNAPELIAVASRQLGVAGRVAHLVQMGLAADEQGEFWVRVRAALGDEPAGEQDFLPGVSRLVVETRCSGPGRGSARVWLRTRTDANQRRTPSR